MTDARTWGREDLDKLTDMELVDALAEAGRRSASYVLWWNLGRQGVEPPRDVLIVMDRITKAMVTEEPAEVEWACTEQPLLTGFMRLARRPGGMGILEGIVLMPRSEAAGPAGSQGVR
jgi:hypothetical protein